MSTVFSPTPVGLAAPVDTPDGLARSRRLDGSRGLAAMLLAAAVAALVVVADQLIDTWVDGHLFLGWVALWVVIFAGSALLAGTARRMARNTLDMLDAWSRSMAEARAEARLWELAKQDPRLKAELIQARARETEAPAREEPPAHDYSQALAPLGLESDCVSPAMSRRMAQAAMRRNAGYLPYL